MPKKGKKQKNELTVRALAFLLGYSPLAALLMLIVIFPLLEPMFLSPFNIYSLLAQVSILGILSCGLTMAVSAGEFDISLGANLTFCSVAVMAFLGARVPLSLTILGTFALGGVIGLLKWLLVCKFHIHSIIATLGVAVVLDGVALVYTKGYRLYKGVTPAFRFLGGGKVGFIPMPAIIMILGLLILWVLSTRTSWGWRLSAVGQNASVSRLLGVSPDRYKFYGLLTSSLFAALAGIVYAARTGTGEPFSKFAYTLDSFVAVSIGLMVLRRGMPHIPGTMVGVFILGVLNNGLVLVGAPFYLQNILKGFLILLAIIVNARLQGGSESLR